MLKQVPKVVGPALLKVLCEMGHGDEIVLADGNFPAESVGRDAVVIRADGLGVAALLDAVLTLIPLDDYVEKPYNPAELIARVKAHLRRYHAWGGVAPKTDEDRIVNGGLILDKKQRIVIVEGEEVRLTATEYKILLLFMEHPGQVFSAEQIYENVWEEEANFTVENTVMVHIRHIREKIEIDTKKPRYIKVVWGIGYKIERYAE